MTLPRLRQVMVTLDQRLLTRRRAENAVVEWQTKVLAHVLSGLAQTQKTADSIQRFIDGVTLDPDRSVSRESWTPESPVDMDDPRFRRNTSDRVFGILAREVSLERKEDSAK